MMNREKTIIEWFYHWESETPQSTFLRQPFGDKWESLSYAEAGSIIRKVCTALKSLGLQKGDHVGIYSKNCREWILADLAIAMGGFVSVPFYYSLPKPQLEEVVRLGDIKVLFVGKLDSWGDKAEAIPDDVQIISFPHYNGNAEVSQGIKWQSLLDQYEEDTEQYVPAMEDLWTIKFTSGTTGTPKGVMHLHRTPARILRDEYDINWIGVTRLKNVRALSFLPLNHVGERIGLELSVLGTGGSISFVESLDTFAQNMKDTQPTIFFAVPRIWNKFYMGITSKLSESKLRILFKIPLIGSVVKKKLRQAIGMNEMEIAAAGGGITPEFIKAFFRDLGIYITEAYGMTEVCGMITCDPDCSAPNDSVGKSISVCKVKLDEETGEVLMYSPYMMVGYYKDQKKTDEVLKDGWLKSGDRGTIDAQGYVRIIGRINDAFKTSKGSFVTPNPLEEVLMENEYIENICVVGLGIPQPLAIVNLSEDSKIVDQALIKESIKTAVKQLNKARAKYEHISTVIIDKSPWTLEKGILTPTLKVKRGKIDDLYLNNYLSWHQDPEEVIWI